MLLNSTQARNIFDKHSFLYENQEAMIALKAGEMFSHDAVIYAIRAGKGGLKTIIHADLGNGDTEILLTYEGLKQVTSYCNQQELINRKKIYGDKPGLKDVKQHEHEVKGNSKIISFEGRRRHA